MGKREKKRGKETHLRLTQTPCGFSSSLATISCLQFLGFTVAGDGRPSREQKGSRRKKTRESETEVRRSVEDDGQ